VRIYVQYGSIDMGELMNIMVMLFTQALASNIVYTYIAKIKNQTTKVSFNKGASYA
jgi:hypothetical protein